MSSLTSSVQIAGNLDKNRTSQQIASKPANGK